MLVSEPPPKRQPEKSNLEPCKSAGAQNCSCPQGQPHLLAREPVLPHSLYRLPRGSGPSPSQVWRTAASGWLPPQPPRATQRHSGAACDIPSQLGREWPLSSSAAPLHSGFLFSPASPIGFPTGAGQAARGRLRGRGCVQLLQDLLQRLGHLHQQRLLGLVGTGGQREGRMWALRSQFTLSLGKRGVTPVLLPALPHGPVPPYGA